MLPDRDAKPEYVAAFSEIAQRIAQPLTGLPKRILPIKMFVAGGAAMHFYTGERISKDIDAAFSHRIALPEDLEVAYRDVDGAARLLYLDRQYSDTFALMHEDAYDDSKPLTVPGIDANVLDVRLLSPLDLAVTKIGRFLDHDRNDMIALARRKLIEPKTLRKRAEDALKGYVGVTQYVQQSIDIACRIAEDEQKRRPRRQS